MRWLQKLKQTVFEEEQNIKSREHSREVEDTVFKVEVLDYKKSNSFNKQMQHKCKISYSDSKFVNKHFIEICLKLPAGMDWGSLEWRKLQPPF